MPNEERRFSWRARLRSFRYAGQGLRALLRTEHNAWIHLVLTILVLVLGVLFRISIQEAMALVVVIALVWITELFNTTLEKTMDFLSKEQHPQIKIIKDMAAAAVLIAAVAAVVVGCLIFIPKLL